MCGRFTLFSNVDAVRDQFSLTQSVVLKPRYNIAPSQLIPTIRSKGQLEFLTWGLRPSWLTADQNSFVNARMETIHEKPAFRQAFKQRRCLIITNGYFEWKKIFNIKQPYFITLPQHNLFAFAGVWEGDTCTIITKPAYQQEILNVHERMPVVVSPQDYAMWLDAKTSLIDLQACMHAKDLLFITTPISIKVNSPKNDSVECIMSLQ